MQSIRLITLSSALASMSTLVQAHEGHGLSGLSHWHSTDAWGFVALGAASLLAWLGGRK